MCTNKDSLVLRDHDIELAILHDSVAEILSVSGRATVQVKYHIWCPQRDFLLPCVQHPAVRHQGRLKNTLSVNKEIKVLIHLRARNNDKVRSLVVLEFVQVAQQSNRLREGGRTFPKMKA